MWASVTSCCPNSINDFHQSFVIGHLESGIVTLWCFSGTDDEQQDYDYLGAWGPRFDKLADMYGQDGESEEEEEQ
jgi:hypothetical protein